MAQCAAVVTVRDTYRRTGRGKSGFELHYTSRRCKREAVEGGRHCWQHAKLDDGPEQRAAALTSVYGT